MIKYRTFVEARQYLSFCGQKEEYKEIHFKTIDYFSGLFLRKEIKSTSDILKKVKELFTAYYTDSRYWTNANEEVIKDLWKVWCFLRHEEGLSDYYYQKYKK